MNSSDRRRFDTIPQGSTPSLVRLDLVSGGELREGFRHLAAEAECSNGEIALERLIRTPQGAQD